jgi:hypothetical protein
MMRDFLSHLLSSLSRFFRRRAFNNPVIGSSMPRSWRMSHVYNAGKEGREGR